MLLQGQVRVIRQNALSTARESALRAWFFWVDKNDLDRPALQRKHNSRQSQYPYTKAECVVDTEIQSLVWR